MGHTLFIADLHLCPQEPAIVAGFLHFLQRDAVQADALYILGDLFEAWIGDDDPEPLHREIAHALQRLSVAGVPVYFIHGNRDFLLGHDYARASGMCLLPEQQVLELHGQRLLILHGDTLCTDDDGYQRFRRRVHQRWLQKLFLALPLALRQRIAERLRAGSKAANGSKSLTIMDVNPDAVTETMRAQQVRVMIHGHTHRPAIHALQIDGEPAERLVLGAWHEAGSMIKVSAAGRELIAFPF
ncbi:UDP-2,3-diacylglucosamine diphosphatase [Pantoea sp. 1.19]|uniref:UDP-2,3-diacylglucosamine diphosphatase n=1 Tax=Pantoea sp. 1.19 TaxID=1925589 RepID=UPI000948AAC5|nr:UDP-2,3-diacylglucosamine diphosphatase [Pantoea sp. 1.19]